MGGLSQEATSDSLAEYFSNYGTVQDATVVKDNVTQKWVSLMMAYSM